MECLINLVRCLNDIIVFLKKIYNKFPTIFITLIVLGSTALIIVIAEQYYFDFFQEKLDSNIVKLNAAFLIILTTILVCVAWIQLHGIRKTARADFLLRLDDRLGSDNIIKALITIHKLYVEKKPECEHAKYYCDACKESHLHKIRQRIKSIGESQKSADGESQKPAEDFIYLKNFLDFMETVGYFSHHGHVSANEVDELMGGTVVYYYNVFKDWINYRQERDNDPSIYREFKWLHDEIKKINKH